MRVIPAFFHALGIFVTRQLRFVILILGILAVVWIAASRPDPVPTETPEQTQARILAQEQNASVMQQQAAQRQIANERTKELCAIKAVCEKYGEVRQQCATAGNYQNCLQIKMGTGDYDKVEACTEDGKPLYITSANMPDAITCFLTR
jgi:hypothetical protein